MTKVKVTIEGHRFVIYKSCVSHNSKTSEGILIKLHRKVKQKRQGVSLTKFKFPQPRSRSQLKVIGLSLTNHVSAIIGKLIKGI